MTVVQVLLVEDNPADADLAIETFAASKLHLINTVVTDGEQALDFLNRRGPYASAIRPDLILLDLNLPRLNGREVLAKIKEHPELKRIPVVVLTSSQAEQDVLETYNLGANCYVTKPVNLQGFQTIVQSIEGFWFTVVKLPPKE